MNAPPRPPMMVQKPVVAAGGAIHHGARVVVHGAGRGIGGIVGLPHRCANGQRPAANDNRIDHRRNRGAGGGQLLPQRQCNGPETIACGGWQKMADIRHIENGAGEGNRTLVVSLGSFCSAIELHPHVAPAFAAFRCGGQCFSVPFRRSFPSPRRSRCSRRGAGWRFFRPARCDSGECRGCGP